MWIITVSVQIIDVILQLIFKTFFVLKYVQVIIDVDIVVNVLCFQCIVTFAEPGRLLWFVHFGAWESYDDQKIW